MSPIFNHHALYGLPINALEQLRETLRQGLHSKPLGCGTSQTLASAHDRCRHCNARCFHRGECRRGYPVALSDLTIFDQSGQNSFILLNFEDVDSDAQWALPDLSSTYKNYVKVDGISYAIDRYIDYSASTVSLVHDTSFIYGSPEKYYTVTGDGVYSELNGPLAVRGSNKGDTFYADHNSHTYEFYTGGGDDTVFLTPASNAKHGIHYSGGNDTYHITETIGAIMLKNSILLEDIDINLVNTGPGKFTMVLDIERHGVLTLYYDDVWNMNFRINLDSGGYISVFDYLADSGYEFDYMVGPVGTSVS